MQHVFISPHLDDAVLSCGGLIARLTRQGQPVVILTLFTASTRPPYSPLALHEHAQWGSTGDPYGVRRAEDGAAAQVLGATVAHAGLPEAIYRQDEQDQWCYTDVPGIFGPVHPADVLMAVRVGDVMEQQLTEASQLYAPLAVGGHVDHVLVHQAVQRFRAPSRPRWCYADVPYALDQPVPPGLAAEFEPLDDNAVDAWIRAVACYRTQVPVLFGSEAEMSERLRAYARRSVQPGLSLYRPAAPAC